MINIIEDDGSSCLIFLGFAEPKGHNKAAEYYNSVKEASIATDGESLNSGDKGGLWVLIEKEKKLALLSSKCGVLYIDKIWLFRKCRPVIQKLKI